ncbi:HAD family hydrolase [Bacillus sp. UMB0893]|uniref:HAD family hydrolase n=1 Tax=Bacillus sp. UMB0893 TaxID=2066053 RepID=UPI000C77AF3E|nr:HAD family hydrolase [Bacillus sp. UMB0893]PLR67048.1 L-2-haloalkanoic acid dehalogenase [Bacillus sp. UMB0893]
MKAILFDLDGTLFNRDLALMNFAEMQYDNWEELHSKLTREQYTELFLRLDKNGYVWKDAVYKTIAKKLELSAQPEDLLKDYQVNFHTSCAPCEITADVMKTLKAKGLKLGIITNGFTEFQRKTIQTMGIEDFFDVVVISEEAGLRKPDTAIFQLALKIMNIEPKYAVYVGDHPENDVKAAMDAGLNAIWMKTKHYNQADHADWHISRIEEVLEVPFIRGK